MNMNGLDQIIVALWFLPVVLFIVIPLCLGALWLPVSLLNKLAARESEPIRRMQAAIS